MRILSIVTLFTPSGDYGGPVRVALNQARALTEAGHSVTVIGGARGYGRDFPQTVDGVPVHLFPARFVIPGIGFAGLASPQLQRWLRRSASNFDIVHIHAARDLVTLPAARWFRAHRVPYVLQTHGMIDPSRNPLAVPLDVGLTRRALRAARTIFYLTPVERAGLIAVAGDGLRLVELRNGVPAARASENNRGLTEVLYLARLAPRKRPLAFVEMATELAPKYPTVRFTIVGPDEGEGAAVTRAIEVSGSHNITWEGALAPERTIERMNDASIYVLPSVDEPFPMSVLEAMSVGLPVVVTDTCGLAPSVSRIGCGLVVDDSITSLTTAVETMLRNPQSAVMQGQIGAHAAQKEFGMAAIARALVAEYEV